MEIAKIILKAHKHLEAKVICNMSNADIASLMGITERAYLDYLNGKSEPKAMKALLNLLSKLDDDDILKVIKIWRDENNE